MKKFSALLLVLVMILALAGCGKTEAAPAEEPAAAPVEEPAAAPAEEPAAEAPAEEPAAEAPAEEPAAEPAAVMSHDEYIAADVDSPVTVETFVQDKQSWWDNKANLYCQSEDGAYFIYETACSEEDYAKLEPGTKIRVTGFKSEWAGEVEIVDGSFEILEGSFVAEPLDVTALLGTDELIAHMNERVCFKGMTVEASDGGAAFVFKNGEEGNDIYFKVSVNGAIYDFTVESYLRGAGTEVYEAVKQLNVGDVIDLEGFLYWYEGANPHIIAVAPAA